MPTKPPLAGGSKSLVSRSTSDAAIYNDQSLSTALVSRAKRTDPHQSTSRALVLRKMAWGSGELAVTRKVSGQEKLELLAKEMMTKAVRAPFRMETLLKMVRSQLDVHLDEISNLKDPIFFFDDIMATINSRTESIPDSNGRRPPLHDSKWVALAVGSRIHNVYLLAGSWRIMRDVLWELEAMGLHVTNVRGQLRSNDKMRAKYLVLYDTVTMLARVGQQRVANIAAATAHYAPYFIRKDNGGPGGPEMEFDHRGNNRRKIREAHKSYIDAIILELVLPDSRYPPYVLMTCLHDAVEECRKEEKRFTQALWDAVGDLSVTLQVLDLLEGPLLGPEGDIWIKDADLLRRSSKEFNQFLVTQASSAQASTMVDSWRNILMPLIETKTPHVLTQLWHNINKSYQQVSGVGIDTLWSLTNDLSRPPEWSTYYVPGLEADSDSDPDRRALTLRKGSKRQQDEGFNKTPKKITQGGVEGSDDDDMPPLMSVSDSSEDGDGDAESDFEEECSEGDSESDFDPDEDEQLQEMLQDALNAAIDIDDFPEPLEDDFTSEGGKKDKNPFTRMLAHLKDRYFSANPTLKADEQSRRPFQPRPGAMPPPPTMQSPPARASSGMAWDKDADHPSSEAVKPTRKTKPMQSESTPGPYYLDSETEEELHPLVPPEAPAPRKSQKTTIEDVADEDDEDRTKQKKKKKKKKSKKVQDAQASSSLAQQRVPVSPSSRQALQEPSPLSASSPSKGAQGPTPKQPLGRPPTQSPIDSTGANFSRTSLPLVQETTAQSSRSYLQSENLIAEKAKVKSRPAFAGSFFRSEKDNKKAADGEKEKKSLLSRMISHLPKKTVGLMGLLIGSADSKANGKKSMKWEEFLKVMRQMGFSYDPSTAGSSVRFDPPDPKDPPITFHKPHPDPTLTPHLLRDFGSKLKRKYGWDLEA